jgi:Ca2+/Na+ antiporter
MRRGALRIRDTWGVLLAFAQFVLFTALIVVVARVLLYEPAKNITSILEMDHRKAGQLLGYLTSSPELVATIFIAVNGFMAAVAYNILSSNIINLVLAGTAAVWHRRFRELVNRGFRREHLIILVSIALPIGLLLTDQIGNIVFAPIFVVLYVIYLLIIKQITTDSPTPVQYHAVEVIHREPRVKVGRSRNVRLALNGLTIVVALVALYFLGSGLGSVITDLGTTYGVPAIVIGGIVGVVTSLPEMTTFFASYSAHREVKVNRGSEEVMHNLLASNVSNLLVIQNVGLILFVIAT